MPSVKNAISDGLSFKICNLFLLMVGPPWGCLHEVNATIHARETIPARTSGAQCLV